MHPERPATVRVLLFGAGDAGRRALATLKPHQQVVAVADNDLAKASSHFAGHPVVSPAALHTLAFDRIVIASMYWREIRAQLETLGYDAGMIEVAEPSRPGAPPSPAATGRFDERDAWYLPPLHGDAGDPPLVSVILPTFNRRPTLARAVHSALAQSHRRLELIVIDDGSDDGSATLLAQLAASDPRVRLLSQPRRGVSAARNAGVAQAEGELIAYLDSDNRWHPDYLMLMVRAFRDPAWATGYAGLNIFDEASGRYRFRLEPFDYDQLRRRNHIDLNVFMHRRELVEALGGFDASLTRLVDWELILRYTRRHPPFVVPVMLADYFIANDAGRISDAEPFRENHTRMLARDVAPPRPRRHAGPLRAAFVQYEYPVLSQTFVQNEIAGLKALGVEVSVFYRRVPSDKGPAPADVEARTFDSHEELIHLLSSRRIDLVHTHFAMPMPADFIVPVCERLGLPFTMKPHAFDIFRRDLDPRHHVARAGSHPLCRAVYCEGEFHRHFLTAEGVPPDRLAVIRNIFDLTEFRAAKPRVADAPRRIVAIARFVEKKGLHLLVEAVRAIADPALRLSLYGYGEEQARLTALAGADPRIAILPGPSSAREAAALLAQADLFALPCVEDRRGDTDGLPTVLMEAMAAGVPVLTSGLASIPDLVIDGETGFLVESGSLPALMAGLRRALASDVSTRERLVHQAWAHLDREFDPRSNCAALLASWQAIVAHP